MFPYRSPLCLVDCCILRASPADRLCIVMKLYKGTLSDEIEDVGAPGLALPRMLYLSAQIARAVGELAAIRVVIQDLKPSNLLLNSYGDVVVADFGLSAQLESSLSRLMISSIRGTPNYMSPEAFDPQLFSGIGTPTDIVSPPPAPAPLSSLPPFDPASGASPRGGMPAPMRPAPAHLS